MKFFLLIFSLLFIVISAATTSLATDKVVVIPLLKNKKIAGDATPADVVQGKTFTASDGEHTGIRPPAPVASDYINKEGVNPPDPRFELFSYNGVEQTGYGVKDLMTGLIWMKSPESSTATWGDSYQGCESRMTTYQAFDNGFMTVSDWRLPTVREMNSLMDYGRGLVHVAGDNAVAGSSYFSSIRHGEYWTSSLAMVPCPGGSARCSLAYTVDIDQALIRQHLFNSGESSPVYSSWCVRGPYNIEY